MSQARPVTCEAITEESRPDLYERLANVIAKAHSSLEETRILLAWNFKWKEDADGVTRLYQVSRVQEVFRDVTEYDAVFVLNHTAFNAGEWKSEHTDAVLDACCCSLMVTTDNDGERREDTKGRTIFRVRKAPVQVFPENIKRHGGFGGHFEQLEATMGTDQKSFAFDLGSHAGNGNGHSEPTKVVELLIDGKGWKKGDQFEVKSEGEKGEICIEVDGSQRLIAKKEYKLVV